MTEREALKIAMQALKTIDEAMPFPVAKLAQSAIKEALAQPEQEPAAWKLVPVEPTKEMLKAMDECSTEGYDERLYAGHAASVYMAAVDAAPTPPAQPQQEPVVWMYVNKSTHETKFQKHMRDFVDHSLWSEVPLYGEPLANHELQCVCGAVWCGDEMVHLPNKAPPQRKPLTDEEIRRANHHMIDGAYDYSFKQGVKWAEYKHGIKGEA